MLSKVEIKKQFDIAAEKRHDMFPYIPVLCDIASKCSHVTEMGIGPVIYGLNSTWGLLYGLSLNDVPNKSYIAYDIGSENYHILGAKMLAEEAGIRFEFIVGDSIEVDIEETDCLFIDTDHRYQHLIKELELHSSKVLKYFIIHDTSGKYEAWEDSPFDDERRLDLKNSPEKYGMWPAVTDFLQDHKEWVIEARYTDGNGLTVLQRV